MLQRCRKNTFSLSLSLSLSHTHTHTLSLTHTNIHAQTNTLFPIMQYVYNCTSTQKTITYSKVTFHCKGTRAFLINLCEFITGLRGNLCVLYRDHSTCVLGVKEGILCLHIYRVTHNYCPADRARNMGQLLCNEERRRQKDVKGLLFLLRNWKTSFIFFLSTPKMKVFRLQPHKKNFAVLSLIARTKKQTKHKRSHE